MDDGESRNLDVFFFDFFDSPGATPPAGISCAQKSPYSGVFMLQNVAEPAYASPALPVWAPG